MWVHVRLAIVISRNWDNVRTMEFWEQNFAMLKCTWSKDREIWKCWILAWWIILPSTGNFLNSLKIWCWDWWWWSEGSKRVTTVVPFLNVVLRLIWRYEGNQLEGSSSTPTTPTTPEGSPATKTPSSSSSSSGGGGGGGSSSISDWFKTTSHIIAVAAAGGGLLLILFSAFVFFCVLKRKRPIAKSVVDDPEAHHSSRNMQPFPLSPVKGAH